MRLSYSLRRLSLLAAFGGLLWVNGCMARLERNIDLVLSPESIDNALVSPYSPASFFAEAFVRWFRQ